MRSSMVDLSVLGNARTAYGNSVHAKRDTTGPGQVSEKKKKGVPSFEDLLKIGLEKVNDAQIRAEETMKAMATGDVDDISEVAAAVSEADMALRMAVQIRDKLLEAYNQLVRISV
ncbi:MAG: hypothetical protein STSR0007_06120 [Thermovirga sp.]